MLESKLRKTGVCPHFCTHSLENACYGSTTYPTLSTLFLQSVPEDRPEVSSILAPFCTVLFNLIIYRRCENTLFCGQKNFCAAAPKMRFSAAVFDKGGRKFPSRRRENPPASPMFHARVSRRKIRAKNRLATAVFHAVFGQNSRSFLHYYIERFYGAKLSARPHDLPLPFAALRRVCGQAVSAVPKLPCGGSRIPRRQETPMPSAAAGVPAGRQSRASPARAACTACFARLLWWFSRAAQDVGVRECFT